eukprot:CAMPEP_0115676726 /NCGR_PEP_ID=MMETSP0272-20121206/54845_1 /TAXON_ID=71861 /ORGANISM="Scrippsiella trochoidea, Strain CCMP3099" /LENGTH=38 /DNA_ID= /DNA_START= /DNA_END= /DNA_ORIENTATION=
MRGEHLQSRANQDFLASSTSTPAPLPNCLNLSAANATM